jgi:adenylate cyclase class IV
MQKEIEVKAKVNDLNILKNKLIDLGCVFTESIVQNDAIFTNFDDADFTKFTNNKNFLRIRKTRDKIYFTLKRPQTN